LRVLILGDSPLLQTGFGRVSKHALDAFLRAGFEVGVVTALQTTKANPTTDLPVTLFVPEDGDELGLRKAIDVIQVWQPDVVYATGDPGNVGAFTAIIPARIPFVSYIPIEGSPVVHEGWRTVLSYIDFFTCSEFGSKVIEESIGRKVPYVYHGVDRDVFNPLTPEERVVYRQRLGWDDKFVIICLAQNVRRKQIPRLIEAVSILKQKFNQKDILLYLHTVPYQQHWLEGWNLPEIADTFGVHDEVVFNPLLPTRFSTVPERGNLDVPGVRELLSSADLFVLPSQVEGFGLPIAEAMASGTPVMVTRYAAGWEVARHGLGVGIPVGDWEIHKSGTKYANVDQMELAKEILRLRRNPKQLEKMREAGLRATDKFSWPAFERYVVEKVTNAHRSAAEAESVTPEADHQTALEAAEDNFRQGQIRPRATEADHTLVVQG